MTLNKFKKAVKKSVEQLSYASEILKAMRVDEYYPNGEELSHINVAIIAVYNDERQRREYRVYYNFANMKSRINYTFHYDYSDACDEFMKTAR
jgi:hypothetical protein